MPPCNILQISIDVFILEVRSPLGLLRYEPSFCTSLEATYFYGGSVIVVGNGIGDSSLNPGQSC